MRLACCLVVFMCVYFCFCLFCLGYGIWFCYLFVGLLLFCYCFILLVFRCFYYFVLPLLLILLLAANLFVNGCLCWCIVCFDYLYTWARFLVICTLFAGCYVFVVVIVYVFFRLYCLFALCCWLFIVLRLLLFELLVA